MKMPNFDGQTMAILVVWGADTECEPFRTQRQQLESSILLAQKKKIARDVIDCVGRCDRCPCPTEAKIEIMPTNTRYDHDRRLNLTWITYRRREAQRLSFRYYYRRVLVVGNCAFQMTR